MRRAMCHPATAIAGVRRRMRGFVRLGAALGVAALSGGAAAADGLAQELQRCKALGDAAARLSGYDAIAVPPPGSAPAPMVPMVPIVPIVPMAPTAAAAPIAPPAPRTAEFGLSVAAPAPAVPDAIESVIPGLFDGWGPQSRLRLANGQVWQISDGSEGTYDLRDPKVRIERGGLGGYFMRVEGLRQTPRVRRIE